ncbi:MAG: hypothetical protein NC930_03955 [Candidatus Omnitrophica bacterium]|nr:hypothetical protein [Candidatus Omnitrophota bacterium]
MEKKNIARLIILIAIGFLGGCCFLFGKWIQGPEVKLKDGYYIQRKLRFHFKIPDGWILLKTPDKKMAKHILRLDGYHEMPDTSAYLPTLAIDYETVPQESKYLIRLRMNEDIASIQADREHYAGQKIKANDIRNHPKFAFQGRLVYSYIGFHKNQIQITEKRYLIKNKVLIKLTLGDFESKVNNRVLEEILASMSFD